MSRQADNPKRGLRHAVSKWILTLVAAGLGVLFVVGYQPDLPLDQLKRKYANEASRFVDVLGMPVHYRDEGTGPVLLLLHGTGASLHTWDSWMETLGYDFRIVRLDLPGFGLTGPDPTRNYTVQRYVEFIQAFTGALGLDRFHLAGNSLGGQIAWNYALAHPDQVDHLVLIDAAGHPGSEDRDPSLVFRLGRIPVVNRLLPAFSVRSLVRNSLLEVYGDPGKVTDELVDRYYELSLRAGNRQAFVDRVNDIEGDRGGDPREITQPTLVLWGMEDRWISPADGQAFAIDIDNSRLVMFPGIGHVPMEEIPGQSARTALTFLQN